jgi:GNAT superfamily N-acetyltransferase
MSERFHSADFEAQTPELWRFTQPLGAGFRCSRGEFVTFWRQGRVEREVRASIAQAFVLAHNGKLAGYATLLADKLTVTSQLLINESIQYQTFPAAKIGLLAVDERAKGVGTRLVEWAIEYAAFELAPGVGLRFVTVDALFDPDTDYDSSPFYVKRGFVFASAEEERPPGDGFRTMYFDLKPLVDVVG